MNALAKDLDDSICAAARDGPRERLAHQGQWYGTTSNQATFEEEHTGQFGQQSLSYVNSVISIFRPHLEAKLCLD